MAFEKFYELPGNNYGRGFVLQEYNEKWYVQEASRPKGDGTIYKTWMSKYKKKGEFLCKEDGKPYVFPLGVEISKQAADAIMASCGEQEGENPF
jgi:hypothetical protein